MENWCRGTAGNTILQTYPKEANILWPESELFFPHNLLQCVSILVYEPGYKYLGVHPNFNRQLNDRNMLSVHKLPVC